MKTMRRIGRAIARRAPHLRTVATRLKAFPFRHASFWASGLLVFIYIATAIAREADSALLGLLGACLIFVTVASICHSIFANRR